MSSYSTEYSDLQQDSLALVDLYNSTNGANWNDNTNWLTQQPLSSWFGIVVREGRVQAIILQDNNLTGTLPGSIGNLTNLQIMTFFANILSGSIPSGIGNLQRLHTLVLDANQFSGSIPNQIGNLSNLQTLDLSGNQLIGLFPNEIGNLSKLQILDLAGNQLSGPIPQVLYGMMNLQTLGLNQNHFSGSISSAIGDLINLKALSLNQNQFTGSIPKEIGNLVELTNLTLDYNQFSGSIPSEIGNLTRLQYLWLRFNQLSGSIPIEINNLVNLHTLLLGNNQFVDLPDLSSMPVLSNLWIENNKFTFEDIEPNISVPTFQYSPQDNIGTTQDITIAIGSSLNISVTVGGANNRYQWTKDGSDIPGANQSSYFVASVSSADAGSYICRITNTVATQLTLYSRPINVTVTGVNLNAPSNLVALASGTSVNLTWADNSNNEAGFKIERKTGTVGSWSEIATVGTNVTSFNNTDISTNQIYYYRVRAYSGGSFSGYSNEYYAITLTAPTNLTATAISTSQINLSWSDNAINETGYKIDRRTTGNWSEIADVSAGSQSYQDNGLSTGTTYTYRVRAYANSTTLVPHYSSYSNESSATTSGDNPPTFQNASLPSSTIIPNKIYFNGTANDDIGLQDITMMVSGPRGSNFTAFTEPLNGVTSKNLNVYYFDSAHSAYANQAGNYTVTLTIKDIINQSKSQSFNVTVSMPPSIFMEFYSHYRGLTNLLPSDMATPLKICADGSQATVVEVRTNGFANNLGMRIAESSELTEFGSFSAEVKNPDAVLFTYTHPRIMTHQGFYREATLELFDKLNGTVYQTRPLHIYRAPVALIHGLWSNKTAFDEMVSRLLPDWPNELINSIDYESTNDADFLTNQNFIALGIIDAVRNARDNNFSIARTNVVTHSMGGLLTRLFLQRDIYRDDICRFIPLNGPHSGSQMANLLLDLPSLIGDVLLISGHNPYNGAVEDLQVDNATIDDLLNGSQLNANTASTHVIPTTYNGPPLAIDSWDALLVSLAVKALGKAVVGSIFNFDSNDLIVAKESQKGGVAASSEEFNNQAHTGSPANSAIISKVITLLNADFLNSTFSNEGFRPPDLFYILPGTQHQLHAAKNLASTVAVQILSPTPNETVLAGQTLTVEVSITDDVRDVFLVTGNPSVDVHWESREVNASLEKFTFTVPEQAFGQYGLAAIGFGDSVFVGLDSVYVSVSTASLLDSISIEADTINVFDEGGIAPVAVVGHFADGITRRLRNHTEMTLQTADPAIASVKLPGIITGQVADTTFLTAMFQGKVANAIVVVLPNDFFTGIDEGRDDDTGNGDSGVPRSIVLQQNYPNPFNPTTSIRFQLPNNSNVSLRIYDVRGQEILQLLNEKRTAGIHEIIWNGRDRNDLPVASGIYLIKLETARFVEVKKMLLVR